MLYAKGISWIDDCRIPTTDKQQVLINTGNKNLFHKDIRTKGDKKIEFVEPIGRFPANILVCDDMLNDGNISKSVKNKSKGSIRKGNVIGDNRTPIGAGLFGDGSWIERNNFNDKGTNSRYYDIDKWFENLLESCE